MVFKTFRRLLDLWCLRTLEGYLAKDIFSTCKKMYILVEKQDSLNTNTSNYLTSNPPDYFYMRIIQTSQFFSKPKLSGIPGAT